MKVRLIGVLALVIAMTGCKGEEQPATATETAGSSGLEIVSSRHFPDEVQGDLILGNAIGFLGIKQHSIEDDGTGWKTAFRHDLLKSTDGNFRPADLEFAPDGSLGCFWLECLCPPWPQPNPNRCIATKRMRATM